MMNLSHRPQMTLSEYCAKCAQRPFKDMRDECKRAQGVEVDDVLSCVTFIYDSDRYTV